MSEENKQAVAKIPVQRGDFAIALAKMMSSTDVLEIASFDPDSPSGAELLVKATLLDLPGIKKFANKRFQVADFYIHPASKGGKAEGEINEFPRCVVFDPEGNAFDCGSGGVIKALAIMARVRKAMHFDPPIDCEIQITDIDNGKQWITLVPDIKSLFANKTTPNPAATQPK